MQGIASDLDATRKQAGRRMSFSFPDSGEEERSQASWQAESPAPQAQVSAVDLPSGVLVSQQLHGMEAFVGQAIPPASSLASEVFIPIPKKLYDIGWKRLPS